MSDMLVMKPTSIDLRERIVAAYDACEGTRQQIADRFKVSLGLVKKLLAQRKNLGTIEPQYQNVGRKPAFDDENLKQLDKFLQKHADATLTEIQEHFSGNVSCRRDSNPQPSDRQSFFKKIKIPVILL